MTEKTVTTGEELDALLDSLGDSSDAVAETLRAAGVKGRRDDSTCCPVANWLIAQVPGANADVQREQVELWLAGDVADAIAAETPYAVRFFIGAFDSCEYPELDERPPRDDWDDLDND